MYEKPTNISPEQAAGKTVKQVYLVTNAVLVKFTDNSYLHFQTERGLDDEVGIANGGELQVIDRWGCFGHSPDLFIAAGVFESYEEVLKTREAERERFKARFQEESSIRERAELARLKAKYEKSEE